MPLLLASFQWIHFCFTDLLKAKYKSQERILVTLDVKNLGMMQRRIMLNLYLMNFSSNSRFN
ncbi:hypothetical protein ZOSMA_17G01000 [Zostera marina]|uniref:Uncharacterized protein n=1 Tax=Zostera marina TaxID=29655 RepID=A0A0K9PRF4_ZOSMR|nr:hypothetical protein ZOSMA_17G01000 [Zostera marina]